MSGSWSTRATSLTASLYPNQPKNQPTNQPTNNPFWHRFQFACRRHLFFLPFFLDIGDTNRINCLSAPPLFSSHLHFLIGAASSRKYRTGRIRPSTPAPPQWFRSMPPSIRLDVFGEAIPLIFMGQNWWPYKRGALFAQKDVSQKSSESVECSKTHGVVPPPSFGPNCKLSPVVSMSARPSLCQPS